MFVSHYYVDIVEKPRVYPEAVAPTPDHHQRPPSKEDKGAGGGRRPARPGPEHGRRRWRHGPMAGRRRPGHGARAARRCARRAAGQARRHGRWLPTAAAATDADASTAAATG